MLRPGASTSLQCKLPAHVHPERQSLARELHERSLFLERRSLPERIRSYLAGVNGLDGSVAPRDVDQGIGKQAARMALRVLSCLHEVEERSQVGTPAHGHRGRSQALAGAG